MSHLITPLFFSALAGFFLRRHNQKFLSELWIFSFPPPRGEEQEIKLCDGIGSD
jgi:hypothetical protein